MYQKKKKKSNQCSSCTSIKNRFLKYSLNIVLNIYSFYTIVSTQYTLKYMYISDYNHGQTKHLTLLICKAVNPIKGLYDITFCISKGKALMIYTRWEFFLLPILPQ